MQARADNVQEGSANAAKLAARKCRKLQEKRGMGGGSWSACSPNGNLVAPRLNSRNNKMAPARSLVLLLELLHFASGAVFFFNGAARECCSSGTLLAKRKMIKQARRPAGVSEKEETPGLLSSERDSVMSAS